MSDSVHITGLADLQKFMDQLAPKLEANVMRGALRAGAKLIQAEAKANVPVQTGNLRQSLKIATSIRGGKVTASVRTKDYIARFVEYGTAAHIIKGRNGGWLYFGSGFARSVNHPGAKAHAFLRPAMDTQAQAAVVAAAEYMKKRLATKEGLDTSDVLIEGDEK